MKPILYIAIEIYWYGKGDSHITWQKQPLKIFKICFGEIEDQWSNLWSWHLGLDKPPIWTADEITWTRLQLGTVHVGITVYTKKYAHGFVVPCFLVVMQLFIMNLHEVSIHIHQGCFAGTGAIVRLPQCQWSKPDGYGKISQCITTTKHSKAKTVCIFLGVYCMYIKKLPKQVETENDVL